uniref:Uncharacterized protein n=1 Tax=Salix viminalis TaxID=40686 RepID=A0A6N2N8J3_SALVM
MEGPAPALIKAEVPWSREIDTREGVISLIFDKAVLEPTFCPMYVLTLTRSFFHSHLMSLVAKKSLLSGFS